MIKHASKQPETGWNLVLFVLTVVFFVVAISNRRKCIEAFFIRLFQCWCLYYILCTVKIQRINRKTSFKFRVLSFRYASGVCVFMYFTRVWIQFSFISLVVRVQHTIINTDSGYYWNASILLAYNFFACWIDCNEFVCTRNGLHSAGYNWNSEILSVLTMIPTTRALFHI